MVKETGKKRLRILHNADMHLMEEKQENGVYFKALVDRALEAKVDLVILAGDLFEHNRLSDAYVETVLAELGRLEAPVVILPGNHDCLVPESVYHRELLASAPRNINIIMSLDGEQISFPELDVAVWGKATDRYGGNLYPLGGIPPRTQEHWQIAVAHGYYDGTEEELTRSGRDYVALGHLHAFRRLENGANACYAGSHTAVIVDFAEDKEIQVCPHPLP